MLRPHLKLPRKPRRLQSLLLTECGRRSWQNSQCDGEDRPGFSALFEPANKRYATSTAVASPEVDQMGRYGIVPRGGKPYIFGFGSEVAAEKLYCPWIAERAFPAHTTMMGALPRHFKASDRFIQDLKMVLNENNIKSTVVGVDIIDGQLILALQEAGFKLGDGQDVMLEARSIKTEDEVMIIRQAAATVDAALTVWRPLSGQGSRRMTFRQRQAIFFIPWGPVGDQCSDHEWSEDPPSSPSKFG